MSTNSAAAPETIAGSNRGLWMVLIVAAVLRVAVAWGAMLSAEGTARVRQPDSEGYIALAESLANSGEFSRDGRPELIRTPGYPLLLVPGVQLRQIDGWAIAVQTVLAILAITIVYSTARTLTGKREIAFWSAAVLAVEPLSVLYTNKVLSESWFTFWIALHAWALLRFERADRHRLIWLVIAALSVAAATYVRPITYLLPAVEALVFVGRGAWRGQIRPSIEFAMLLLMMAMMPAAIWQVRNYLQGDFAGFSAIADIDLYFLHRHAVLEAQAGRQLPSTFEFDENSFLADHPEMRTQSWGKRYPKMRREAISVITHAPLIYVRVHAKGMLSTLLDNGTNAWLDMFGHLSADQPRAARAAESAAGRVARALRTKPRMVATSAALSLCLVMLWLTVALGMLRVIREHWPGSIWLFVLLSYLIAVSGGPIGGHRFRLPMVPVLAIFAGVALARLAGQRLELGRSSEPANAR